MKIEIWSAIIDHGDGSHGVRLFASEKALRDKLKLNEDDFEPGGEVPVEIDSHTMRIEWFIP